MNISVLPGLVGEWIRVTTVFAGVQWGGGESEGYFFGNFTIQKSVQGREVGWTPNPTPSFNPHA